MKEDESGELKTIPPPAPAKSDLSLADGAADVCKVGRPADGLNKAQQLDVLRLLLYNDNLHFPACGRVVHNHHNSHSKSFSNQTTTSLHILPIARLPCFACQAELSSSIYLFGSGTKTLRGLTITYSWKTPHLLRRTPSTPPHRTSPRWPSSKHAERAMTALADTTIAAASGATGRAGWF